MTNAVPAVRFDGDAVLVTPEGGPESVVAVHGTAGGWTLMAVFEHEGRPVGVLEELGAVDGRVAFLSADGPLALLPSTLEDTSEPETGLYRGFAKEEVVAGPRDVLREAFLADEGDPSYADVAAAIPPVRRIAENQWERPHTFLGSPDSFDVVPVHYDALRATNRVNPAVVAPDLVPAITDQHLLEGIVGGSLPTVRLGYPVPDGGRWESLAFAPPESATTLAQPVWYRFVRLDPAGGLRTVRYVDTYLPYPRPTEPDPAGFYRALLGLHAYWDARVRPRMTVDLPEPWIADFVRHAFTLEQITRFGDHPKYGVVDRIYGGAEHDGFQDILTASAAAYLEWGMPDVAARYLDNYFTEFVRDDGSIAYRGPEIGQYGRMLTVLAQHWSFSRDDSMLRRHEEKVRAIADLLLERREDALRRSSDAADYGMIAGRHEADISFDTPTLGVLDYERPYFSNSAEAARGFRDLGRALRLAGRIDGRDGWLETGLRLGEEGDALAADLRRSIERSWIERNGFRQLPIIAGSPILHRDAPYRSIPESYDDNRVWFELLHSGMLDAETVRSIVEAGSRRGDSTFGIFGNRKLAVAFMAHGVGYGLLQHDLVREFLLLYYAHAAHLHTRGTWTALECADLDRSRAEHWPYCLPAQMTIPLLTKWMLVFEDPQTDELWLAKATPREWLRAGQRIEVAGAPTSAGPVDYRIAVSDGRVDACVTLRTRRPADIWLRLRLPDDHVVDTVQVLGAFGTWHSEREAVCLSEAVPGDITIEVRTRAIGPGGE